MLCQSTHNEIKDQAEEKGDPHAVKSVAAPDKLFKKRVAACITKASAHHDIARNKIKHEDEEKAAPRIDEGVTGHASTECTLYRYRGVLWTNPQMVALMAPSSRPTRSPGNRMLAVPVKAATSAERAADDAELAADDARDKFMTAFGQSPSMIQWRPGPDMACEGERRNCEGERRNCEVERRKSMWVSQEHLKVLNEQQQFLDRRARLYYDRCRLSSKCQAPRNLK
jgi:hypothetical protein